MKILMSSQTRSHVRGSNLRTAIWVRGHVILVLKFHQKN